MMRVAITGGICSGKSSICRLIESLGYSVYYCDDRAAQLINSNEDIRSDIVAIFGEQAYQNGTLNRQYISSAVFSDRSLLERLNGVTHPRVVDDFILWAAQREAVGERLIFVESAILFESGLDRVVDSTIAICSPVELRIARCQERDGLSREQVLGRIASQMRDSERSSRSQYTIVCDDRRLVIPQLLEIIDCLSIYSMQI